MHDTHDEHGTEEQNFEPTDMAAMPVFYVIAGLFIVTGATFLGGYFALGFAKAKPAATNYVPTALTEPRQAWTQDVRLQADVRADYEAHYANTHPKVSQYGIVSENPEIYHFPVEDAMDHIAEHGFPKFPKVETGQ